MEIRVFVEERYFPTVEANLSASTIAGYRSLWKLYGGRLGGEVETFRPLGAAEVLAGLRRRDLTTKTLSHIKAFYSGIFSYAVELGLRDDNPFAKVRLPRGRESEETIAYNPQDIESMVLRVGEPGKTVLLLAAYTGLRRSEIRGLRWEDVDFEARLLSVRRGYVGSGASRGKSRASRAAIPLAVPLGRALEGFKAKVGGQEGNPVFMASNGSPLDLHNLAERVIRPELRTIGIEWRGFHCLRRGLATYLHAKDIEDITIQRILRHQNVEVTRQCYIKAVPEKAREAMAMVDYS